MKKLWLLLKLGFSIFLYWLWLVLSIASLLGSIYLTMYYHSWSFMFYWLLCAVPIAVILVILRVIENDLKTIWKNFPKK